MPLRRERKMPSEDVLKKINLAREERKANIRPKEVAKKSEKIIPTKCLLGDKAFSVVSSVELKNNIGCYLAKNDNGYVVISYVGEKISKIKEYPTLKSEKIQARLSETLSSGTQRFLIRIGINKFVVDVIDDSVQYVMDLC